MTLYGLTRRINVHESPELQQITMRLHNLGHYLQTAPVETMDLINAIGELELIMLDRDRAVKGVKR